MKHFGLVFILSFTITFCVAQTFEGVFVGSLDGETYVLKIREQGELVLGEWLDKRLLSMNFLGKKEQRNLKGVLSNEGEEGVEISGVLDKRILHISFVGNGKQMKMERLSKELAYDFTKVFPEGDNLGLREKITGIWIEKENYKMEDGEKVFSELSGKEYMRAFNEDGKHVMDIRALRDMEQEANKDLNLPQHLRPKASDFFEMSQMMSWKVVGNDLYIYLTQPIPGAETLIYQVEFEDEKMILKSKQHSWISVFVRKE